MCLACFKTISPASNVHTSPLKAASESEHDHVCAFAFPERRANDVTFEDGPKRRQSDMDWQAIMSREDTLPAQ